MVKLVDTQDLGSCGAIRKGSNPFICTGKQIPYVHTIIAVGGDITEDTQLWVKKQQCAVG